MVTDNTGKEGENLSRIRDILFGEDLEGIEQKLEVFKNENLALFEKLKQDLDVRLMKIEQLLEQKEKKTDDTQKKTAEEQKTINQDFKQEIVKINHQLVTENEKITTTFKSETKNITTEILKLKTSFEDSVESVRKDLSEKIELLSTRKTDNETLADIFSKLGNELREQKTTNGN